MVDFAIAECQYWASHYQEGPVRPAAVDGVKVRDDLNTDLLADLLREIAVLRNQPAIGSTEIDRHPGSLQIVDLVHPSMYAYEKGQTMVLEGAAGGAQVTQMPEWSSYLSKQQQDVMVEEPGENQVGSSYRPLPFGLQSECGLQWLPAEFRVSADGQDCEISSYINSLHPIQHAALYPLIGKLFCHCVPLLEQVLAELGDWHPFQNSRHVRYTPPSARDRHRRIDPGFDWWNGRPLKRDDYEQQQQQQ